MPPAIIYTATVVLYLVERHKLLKGHGFHLGVWERVVIAAAVVWLGFELPTFRDGSFSSPWLYAVIMTAIGVAYYVWMSLTGRSLAMPGTLIAPGDELKEAAAQVEP